MRIYKFVFFHKITGVRVKFTIIAGNDDAAWAGARNTLSGQIDKQFLLSSLTIKGQ